MEANALGLQWRELSKLQAAFPKVEELDFRKRLPSVEDAQHLAALPGLQRIMISSILRTEDPEELLQDIHDLGACLQQTNPKLTVAVEIRLGMAHLSHNSKACQQMTLLPANISIISLEMPQQCGAFPALSLHLLLTLQKLEKLNLVLYTGVRIGDNDFSKIAGLRRLQNLAFGLMTHVTDKGVVAGLQGLHDLQHLELFDVSSITDACIEDLTPKLGVLQFLSLSKCQGLTNKGLESLSRMPALTRLFITENDQITNDTAQRFRSGSQKARCLHIRHCPNVSQADIFV